MIFKNLWIEEELCCVVGGRIYNCVVLLLASSDVKPQPVVNR